MNVDNSGAHDAHLNMYRKDASIFRDLLDQFFHCAPIEANGTIKLDAHSRGLIDKLSEHTYRGGKMYVKECRDFLALNNGQSMSEGK